MVDYLDEVLYSKEWDSLLQEVTRIELLRKSKKEDQKVAARSNTLVSNYLGIRKGSQLLFKTTSGTEKGKYWVQVVKVDISLNSRPMWNDVLKSLRGNLKVWCNCPSWKWHGYWYILGKMDAVFGRKTALQPIVMNPRLKGSICKHLYNVLSVLPANMPEIVRDFQNRRKGVLRYANSPD